MDDAPAHRSEEQLPEEEPAADVEQQPHEEHEGESCGSEADDDAQLAAGQREFRAQQRQVRRDHAHEGGTNITHGFADTGRPPIAAGSLLIAAGGSLARAGRALAAGCRTGLIATARPRAGRRRIAGTRRGSLGGVRFECQGPPRFESWQAVIEPLPVG